MRQHIGFCAVGGHSVAYSTVGEGPTLLVPASWFSHLEHDWEHPGYRAFISALAEHYTVVRYDRIGTGLSDRGPWSGVPSMELEVATLEAVRAAAGDESVLMFAMSCGGCIAAHFAARHPERVDRLVFYGAYAHGPDVAEDEVTSLMLRAVRTHWSIGSRLLTEIFLPEADPDERRFFERSQRASASAEVAGDLLEFVYGCSAIDEVGSLRAPCLVIHRRGDRAIPFELGRRLAGLVPGARFLPLEGRMHVPWLGHSRPVLEATIGFLGRDDGDRARPVRHDGSRRSQLLSAREREVLRLVAAGMPDEQIAGTLVVSPHTVHRHVANIRTKLRQSTRTAAAVEATRRGLI